MHGVKRSRIPPTQDSAEVTRKKKEKEQEKIQEYTRLTDELTERNKAQDHSQDALNLTTKILQLNSEFQTAWSIRRKILLDGPLLDADAETRQSILETDLNLTNFALKQNPKNYSTWEHRKWVLETMPDANWAVELKLVEAFLEKDGRNFHSWDYRRYVISSLLSLHSKSPSESSTIANPKRPIPTTSSELAYSKKKIAENFSNFSAWHYRTKLLPKLWEEQGWGEESEQRKRNVDQEFEIVKQAIWSDPNDQSAWLYHRWLVGKGSVPIVRREILGIEELLEEEPDSRWCLESLVYYKRLLTSLLDDETSTEKDELNASCLEMLKTLQKVDPMRQARYRDLESHIVPYRR